MEAVGTVLIALIGGFVVFLIAAGITRAIFSIRKIVRLLEVIAQELRARNIVDSVNEKLDHNKENVQNLNQLWVTEYQEASGE